MLKRFFDILISSVLIVMMLPVWFLAVCVILLGDPGPLFFRQQRIGKGGQPFSILKFRTMRVHHIDTSVTTKGDPRIFRGGDFLRRFKIDELPQLFNVLLGDMSLVGPRPTVAEDYEKMSEEQRSRSTVRPGITGLAQISGNTALPWQERIALDLDYIHRSSLRLDFVILIRTIVLILTDRAETHPDGKDEWR